MKLGMREVMMMKFPYNETVLEHFKHPRNVGKIEDPDGKAIEGSPSCGDMVAVYINVNEESKRIEEIKFESYGCASNIATGSIITELTKGKTLDEAKNITWKQASEALGGLPPVKAHCSVLAVEGLRSAIRNYEERHGIGREKIVTTVDVIEKRLRHVMNPLVGLDLVRTKMDDGTVRILVDLPADHQFAAAIREDITDKIEPLWDIDAVVVEYTE